MFEPKARNVHRPRNQAKGGQHERARYIALHGGQRKTRGCEHNVLHEDVNLGALRHLGVEALRPADWILMTWLQTLREPAGTPKPNGAFIAPSRPSRLRLGFATRQWRWPTAGSMNADHA